MRKINCEELSRILCSLDLGIEEENDSGEGTVLEGCIRWLWIKGDIDPEELAHVEFHIENLAISVAEYDDVFEYGLENETANLHFRNCYFDVESHRLSKKIEFQPRFHNTIISINQYLIEFRECKGSCIFSFPDSSILSFIDNDFQRIRIYQHGRAKMTQKHRFWISFVHNQIEKLELKFQFPCLYPTYCEFIEGNAIDILTWEEVTERGEFNSQDQIVRFDDVQEYNLIRIFISRAERIGERLLKKTRCIRRSSSDFVAMRELFIKLKIIAHARGDIDQENISASYISLIEYVQIKNNPWHKLRFVWQDFLLFWWRYKSSRFYTSWIRPLVYLSIGYFLINAIPFLSIDSTEYLAFCLSSPTKLPFFADNLKEILGAEKFAKSLYGIDRVWLDLLGILRLIWLTLFGYAFKNAIKARGWK